MINEKFLRLLSKDYPNRKKAIAEIINLRAILALPKGTEYFLSDIHGEHEAFVHMVKSASGVIRSKIEEVFSEELPLEERDRLAALIYNPKAEIKRVKKSDADYDQWCRESIFHLIQILKSVSTKYTRSKVRKRMPEDMDYIMDELLHADDEANRADYYGEIINALIETGNATEFIMGMAGTISRLAVDQLHIIGDIFDRGAHPDKIMDFLMDFHDVDFQWGNHDIVWMGAATGNWACITNAIRMNVSYNNFDMLETGYGINLRPLAVFANDTYRDDSCEGFKPHIYDRNQYDPISEELAAKMHKAIAICQFKVEGQRIKAHPEYGMEHRLLLDKINMEKGTVVINGTEYPLKDKNLPTLDVNDPYKLSDEERLLLNTLEASFLKSEKLQKHIRFLYSHGSMYKIVNDILLYHGCIPLTEEGEFEECTVNGVTTKGKAYLDYLDDQVRKAYFSPAESEEIGRSGDLMWYLWLSKKSPLFGKDKMTTFERCFVDDKSVKKENNVSYYRLIDRKDICENILKEFGLDPLTAHILNGHMPVKVKDGGSPVRGQGLLFVIDGGMSKAYQKDTGIAGYTFIYNSRFMALAEHKPYSPLMADGSQEFNAPALRTVEVLKKRMMVRDTDIGKELIRQVEELQALVDYYDKGIIKER
ncbi:MAG: fructose-1,6-bisphosphatase [Clostridiales bacterium]|nr:fructose-1,6-bisphosphatase [Clostridiales bacterium]